MNHLKLGKCRENWGLGSKQMWRYLSKEMPPSPVEISCRDFARCAQKAFKLCAFGNQCIRKLVNSLPTGKCQPTDTQSGRVMKSWNHRLHITLKSWKTNYKHKNKTLKTQDHNCHLSTWKKSCVPSISVPKSMLSRQYGISSPWNEIEIHEIEIEIHGFKTVWNVLPSKWNWN